MNVCVVTSLKRETTVTSAPPIKPEICIYQKKTCIFLTNDIYFIYAFFIEGNKLQWLALLSKKALIFKTYKGAYNLYTIQKKRKKREYCVRKI